MTLEQALNHIITLYGEKILDDSNFCQRELGNAGFDDSSLEARLLFVLLDKNAVSEIRQMIQQNQGITKYSLAIKAYAKMFADETVSNEYQTIFLEHIQMLIDLFSDEGIVESLYPNHKDIMPVDNFESALEKLISDYGVSVLAAPARARAILNDLSGNMLKEESLEFEELLRKLNGGASSFQNGESEKHIGLLGQILKKRNLEYEPIERELERYDLWNQEANRKKTEHITLEKSEKVTEHKDEIKLQKKAEQGDGEAQCVLADMYYNGDGVPVNYEKAIKWYRRAADKGHVKAQYILGLMYYNGEGVIKDDLTAAIHWTNSAKQGYAAAQYSLANMYYFGEGFFINKLEAERWYREAAEQGHIDATIALYNMYFVEGLFENKDEAEKWCRELAERGYADAQYNLGVMYYDGKGVVKNHQKAIEWFLKAAEQGHAIAQYNLGNMYYYGKGGVKNYSEAEKWYRKAATQDYADAQCMLADMYYSGKGIKKDCLEALRWYSKAAEQGVVVAQNKCDALLRKLNVGNLYEEYRSR